MWRMLGVAVLVAGCLSGQGPLDDPDPVAPEPKFSYDCVFGDKSFPSGACYKRLVDPVQSYTEPVMAIHPHDPEILVIAAHLGERAPDPGASSGAYGGRMALIVSRDGGASWEVRKLPAVHQAGPLDPVELPAAGDPAIAFDRDGTLHVMGMSTPMYRTGGMQIFQVSTQDLGATWSPASILATDSDNDREWLAIPRPGLVVGVWQNTIPSGWTVEATWSSDGGTTWQAPQQTIPMCSHAAPPILHQDRILVACASYENVDDALGIAIHELDVRNGTFARVALVEKAKAWWPRLIGAPDGALLLIADTDIDLSAGSTTLLLRSMDGQNWSDPVDVSQIMQSGSAWDARRHYATGPDHQGMLHLVIVGASPDPTGTTYAEEKVHLVLHPSNFTLMSERALVPASGAPDTVPVGLRDDWGDVATLGESTYVVWARDFALDVARITYTS